MNMWGFIAVLGSKNHSIGEIICQLHYLRGGKCELWAADFIKIILKVLLTKMEWNGKKNWHSKFLQRECQIIQLIWTILIFCATDTYIDFVSSHLITNYARHISLICHWTFAFLRHINENIHWFYGSSRDILFKDITMIVYFPSGAQKPTLTLKIVL